MQINFHPLGSWPSPLAFSVNFTIYWIVLLVGRSVGRPIAWLSHPPTVYWMKHVHLNHRYARNNNMRPNFRPLCIACFSCTFPFFPPTARGFDLASLRYKSRHGHPKGSSRASAWSARLLSFHLSLVASAGWERAPDKWRRKRGC